MALWADVLQMLHYRMGVTAMGFDYRGYGRSEGTPSEAGVLADARAARTWLAQRTGVAENQIVLMGRSLGGAVAVDLAADGARGLILESTFTSMPEVGHAMLPYLPVRLLMQTQFNSLAKIGKYHGPLLQSHGTGDRLIPYAMGRQLFDAANEPKQFVEIPGGDHNDPQSAGYYAALDEFLVGCEAREVLIAVRQGTGAGWEKAAVDSRHGDEIESPFSYRFSCSPGIHAWDRVVSHALARFRRSAAMGGGTAKSGAGPTAARRPRHKCLG